MIHLEMKVGMQTQTQERSGVNTNTNKQMKRHTVAEKKVDTNTFTRICRDRETPNQSGTLGALRER